MSKPSYTLDGQGSHITIYVPGYCFDHEDAYCEQNIEFDLRGRQEIEDFSLELLKRAWLLSDSQVRRLRDLVHTQAAAYS